jgi:hypothetical protein
MKQNIPYEIINQILEMKSDLEEIPVYLQFSESGKEYYKINRFSINKKLQVLYEFRIKYPPKKMYISFLQEENYSQMGYAYAYTFPIKNGIKYDYYIQKLWSYCSNYIWIKSVRKHPITKMIYERGWASVFEPDNDENVQYPILGSLKFSEIFFFPNIYYDYLTFRILGLDVIDRYHFCSQFFYTFHSNYFQEYDENLGRFVHKIMPKFLIDSVYENEESNYLS